MPRGVQCISVEGMPVWAHGVVVGVDTSVGMRCHGKW